MQGRTMVTRNSTQAISHVRHPDKYKCVLMCIEKEEQGFECVQPIKRVSYYRKNFNHSGKFIDYASTDEFGYYEAIYRKKLKG